MRSRSLDQPLDLLELGRVGAASSSNSAVSTLVSTAPARSIFCRPSSLVLGASASRPRRAATWTSTPLSSRSSDGLVDADVGLDPADERLVAAAEVEAVGLGGGEADLLERLDALGQVLGDLGDRVARAPSGTAR